MKTNWQLFDIGQKCRAAFVGKQTGLIALGVHRFGNGKRRKNMAACAPCGKIDDARAHDRPPSAK